MANILFVSDFNANQINDNPGGDTPTGTVEWLTPLLHTTFEGTTPNTTLSAGSAPVQLILQDENQYVWPRSFNYYSGNATKSHLVYTVTNNDLNVLATNYASNALSGFTMNLEPFASTAIWRKGSARRLLLSTSNYYPGTNPLQFASVNLDSGQLHTGLTAAQISNAIGVSTSMITSGAPRLMVSPDGTQVTALIRAAATSNRQEIKLYKITLDGADQFSNIQELTGYGAAKATMGIGVTTNNAIYTQYSPATFTGQIQKRDINTGALVANITPPVGTQWYDIHNPALQTGSAVWFFSKTGTTTTNAYNAGLKLYKISRSTDQVVAQWDLSNPPTTAGFTPAAGEPSSNKGNQGLESAQFDRDGILYISYGDRQNQQVTGGYQVTRRFYRVKLS